MSGSRIDFPADDAAKFNLLRDQWRGAASGCSLSKSGLRIANVLPSFLSREFGYCFPTDEDLAKEIGANPKTVKRGLSALEASDLIERITKTKRDDKGEAIGKLRRIYLTLPDGARKPAAAPKGEGTLPPEVKGQKVKGQVEVKGQKRVCEGTPVCPNIPDQDTLDQEIRSGEERFSSTRTGAREREVKGQVRTNPYRQPGSWGDDVDFLEAFDSFVIELTGGEEIRAGEIEKTIEEAFDRATRSSDDFMPVYWRDIVALRTGQTADWFRWRAAQFIHLREAA